MNFPTKHPAEPTIDAIIEWYVAARDRSVSLRFPARPSAATGSGEGYGAITNNDSFQARQHGAGLSAVPTR